MDNAKIHKSKQYILEIFDKFYTLLYSAPYTPQYNPIEFGFSIIKNYYRKKNLKEEKEIISTINEGIKQITKNDIIGYIYNTIKMMKLGF